MKISLHHLITALAALALPAAASAQSNITRAFDDIIKCKDAQITESHRLDKDPGTNRKTGQADVYHFVIPASDTNLVQNLVEAFEKDSDKAFSINRGTGIPGETDIILTMGDGSTTGIRINDPDTEYVYALFLAPESEDPDGFYRYAYGINFKEEEGLIKGKLAITYGMTLKHRQELEQQKRMVLLHGYPAGTVVLGQSVLGQSATSVGKDENNNWFESIMECLRSLNTTPHQTLRTTFSAKAYSLIKNAYKYPQVTESEIRTVISQLNEMIDDKKNSEPTLNKLLTQCRNTLVEFLENPHRYS